MIERNIKLKDGLKQVMSDIVQTKYVITPDDMYKMNTLVDLLRHFKATTDVLSVAVGYRPSKNRFCLHNLFSLLYYAK